LHNLIIDKEGTDEATLQRIKSSDTAETGASVIRGPRRYNRATREAYNIRERFKIYFNGEGAVDFHWNQIDTYVELNTLNDVSYRLSLFLITILHRSAYIILNTRNYLCEIQYYYVKNLLTYAFQFLSYFQPKFSCYVPVVIVLALYIPQWFTFIHQRNQFLSINHFILI